MLLTVVSHLHHWVQHLPDAIGVAVGLWLFVLGVMMAAVSAHTWAPGGIRARSRHR